MSDQWLPTLITPDAQSGYDLAVKLARVAVKMTQPDADALIMASSVVATHFSTVAAANNYWK